MRKFTDKQINFALDVAPHLLSYEQLITLSNSDDLKVKTLARKNFAKYILKHDIENDQMAVYALKFLSVMEDMLFFDLFADDVVRKVITYLNGRTIQLDDHILTTEDLQNALNLIEENNYKLAKTERGLPIIQLINEKNFFFYLRKTPIEDIQKEENLNNLMELFLEDNYFQEYIFSQEPYIVAFRNAVNNSPAIQEKVLEFFLQSNHCSFYYLACLAYIASGGIKEKWGEYLSKIFAPNVSSEFHDFVALVKRLKWNDKVISFLFNSTAPHLKKMKPFYLKSFDAKREDVLNAIDFSMEINDLAELLKKLNQIEPLQLLPEEVEEIYYYKIFVLNLFHPSSVPCVIEKIKQHLPTSLKGLSYMMMKCFYNSVFSQLSKEEQFNFLEQHWDEDECVLLLGLCPDEFVKEFMNQSN